MAKQVITVDEKLIETFLIERENRLNELRNIYKFELKSFLLSLLYISLFLFVPYLLLLPIVHRIHPKLIPSATYFSNVPTPILVAAFLTVILVAKILHRRLAPIAEKENMLLEEKSNKLFDPFERTAIICLDIAKALDRYAKNPIIADFESNDLESLSHFRRRDLIGYSSYHETGFRKTNSFFVSVNNENDIRSRLERLGFLEKLNSNKEIVIKLLSKIHAFLKPKGDALSGDFGLGALLFRKISEAFILAHNGDVSKFVTSLNDVSLCIDEYCKTTRDFHLIGMTLVIVKFFKLIWHRKREIILLPASIVFAMVLAILLPNYIINKFPFLTQNGIDKGLIGIILISAATFYVAFLQMQIKK